MPIVRELLVDSARALPGAEARREAALLLRHVLGQSDAWLVAHANDSVAPSHETTFHDLVARRSEGQPIAYLTGKQGFHALELHVTPDVLIPRPETELLVELALARIPFHPPSPDEAQRNPGAHAVTFPDCAASRLHPGYAVADLGTGSGAVALAIANARPQCRMVATDVSEGALAVARGNAERLRLHNVTFARSDWCAALGDTRFDLVVSNPPYVALGDPHLREGDLRFEPSLALASGVDGLDAIRIIVRDAHTHLREGGWLLFEHGLEQGAAARELLATHDYAEVFTERDLEGRERVSGGRFTPRA